MAFSAKEVNSTVSTVISSDPVTSNAKEAKGLDLGGLADLFSGGSIFDTLKGLAVVAAIAGIIFAVIKLVMHKRGQTLNIQAPPQQTKPLEV